MLLRKGRTLQKIVNIPLQRLFSENYNEIKKYSSPLFLWTPQMIFRLLSPFPVSFSTQSLVAMHVYIYIWVHLDNSRTNHRVLSQQLPENIYRPEQKIREKMRIYNKIPRHHWKFYHLQHEFSQHADGCLIKITIMITIIIKIILVILILILIHTNHEFILLYNRRVKQNLVYKKLHKR